jgi:hypothetical protein
MPRSSRPHPLLLGLLAIPALVGGLAGPAGAADGPPAPTTATTGTATTTTAAPPEGVGGIEAVTGLTVTPSSGLHDGDRVRLHAGVEGTGSTRFFFHLCANPLETESEACTNVGQADWRAGTALDTTVKVPAVIPYSGSGDGDSHGLSVDCRRQANCWLIVLPYRQPDEAVQATVSFARSGRPAAVQVSPRYTG